MAEGRAMLMACLLAAVTACAQAPAYRPPQIPAPASFRETGPWVPATPARVDGGPWWNAFNDPVLDALETRLNAANPTLAEALARHRAALAAVAEARSGLFPAIGAGGQITANRQSDTRPLRGANQPDLFDANTLGVGVGYEVDLWGRIANTVATRRAEAQASADDAAALRLALETDLANAYVALAGLDREREVLARSVNAYRAADAIVHHRFAGGIADGIDLGRSGAQLADAEAQLAEVEDDRARTEHAIASLVGTSASLFVLPPTRLGLAPVPPPDVVPSTLLQHRPDVAAAERHMFSANRQIGVARAAFFPALGLTATGGWQSTALAGLVSTPNLFWSAGPGLALPLLDGSARAARVRQARAQWDEAVASYRATVLAAFQQVEDALSRLHHLDQAAAAANRASLSAAAAADLSFNRYVDGAANYLDVVTAQTAQLAASRRAIQAETRRAEAGIALVRALGGGRGDGGGGAGQMDGHALTRSTP